MTHPIIKTDNYTLITSDEEIKEGDWYLDTIIGVVFKNDKMFLNGVGYKKIIAHLPLNNEPILEGVPLLPPLPNEDIDLAAQEYPFLFIEGYKKAKEKYKFTEEDVIKIVEKSRETGLTAEFLMLSLSQPKLPVGFKCETISLKQLPFNVEMSVDEINKPKIFKGVMQGEWIFE